MKDFYSSFINLGCDVDASYYRLLWNEVHKNLIKILVLYIARVILKIFLGAKVVEWGDLYILVTEDSCYLTFQKKVFALFSNGMHLFTFAIFYYCISPWNINIDTLISRLYCRKTHEKCIFINIRNYVKYFEGSPTWFKRNLLSFVCCMNASFYL